MSPRRLSAQQGFYLIEVLVTVMLTSLALLGMLALQSRSIAYSHDSQQRQNAILLAADLTRSMQANRETLIRNGRLRSDSAYLVAAGSQFPTLGNQQNCDTRGLGPADRASRELACWVAEVKRALDTDDTLLRDSSHVCPTRDGKSCATGATAPLLLVQLAWHSRNCRTGSATIDEDDDAACLSADDKGGVERYRLSFQP